MDITRWPLDLKPTSLVATVRVRVLSQKGEKANIFHIAELTTMHHKPNPKFHTFSLIVSASGLLAILSGCPTPEIDPDTPVGAGNPCRDIVCQDDGLFCNGVEDCHDGICLSSGDPCSEGDACDEDRDSCAAPVDVLFEDDFLARH